MRTLRLVSAVPDYMGQGHILWSGDLKSTTMATQDNHPEWSPGADTNPKKARLQPRYILLIGFVIFILIALLFWVGLL